MRRLPRQAGRPTSDNRHYLQVDSKKKTNKLTNNWLL